MILSSSCSSRLLSFTELTSYFKFHSQSYLWYSQACINMSLCTISSAVSWVQFSGRSIQLLRVTGLADSLCIHVHIHAHTPNYYMYICHGYFLVAR